MICVLLLLASGCESSHSIVVNPIPPAAPTYLNRLKFGVEMARKQLPAMIESAEAAAKRIYEMKWRPFFSQVDKRHWYRFKGKPFIYFYNAGTLLPRTRSAALIARLKQMFAAEFQEEAFVVADSAYFEDPAMEKVAEPWRPYRSAGSWYLWRRSELVTL